MPYRPIYVAAYRTHEGVVEFIWDRDRETVYESHQDDAYLVRTGELAGATFALIDVPVSALRTRGWLLDHPNLWSP